MSYNMFPIMSTSPLLNVHIIDFFQMYLLVFESAQLNYFLISAGSFFHLEYHVCLFKPHQCLRTWLKSFSFPEAFESLT